MASSDFCPKNRLPLDCPNSSLMLLPLVPLSLSSLPFCSLLFPLFFPPEIMVPRDYIHDALIR